MQVGAGGGLGKKESEREEQKAEKIIKVRGRKAEEMVMHANGRTQANDKKCQNLHKSFN